MTRFLKVALVVILAMVMSTTVFAATNVYKDTYTTEDSAGNWTFTSITPTKVMPNVEVVAATPATITVAVAGKTFIVDNGVSTTQTQCVTFTLPPAAADLTYTFVSGDGSGMVIRTADSNWTSAYTDTLMWGQSNGDRSNPATNTQLRTSPGAVGATGATIKVIGATGFWYVQSQATPTVIAVETRTEDPKVGG